MSVGVVWRTWRKKRLTFGPKLPMLWVMTTKDDLRRVALSARGRHVIRVAVARAVRDLSRCGETTAALAERFGLTPQAVARWIRGDGYPAFTIAQRLAPLVGVDPETGVRKVGAA